MATTWVDPQPPRFACYDPAYALPDVSWSAGHSAPAAAHCPPPTVHRPPPTVHRSPATGHRPLATALLCAALLLALGAPAHAQPAGEPAGETPEPFSATLLAPAGGDVIRGGVPYEVKWSVTGATGPVTARLESSADGGMTWTPISADLRDLDAYPWIVPAATAPGWRLRVRVTDAAQRTVTAETDAEFALDDLPPLAYAQGVAERLPRVAVAYRAQDVGTAGLAAVTLFYRKPGDAEWLHLPEFKAAPPLLELPLPEGTYELYLTARDAVGNAEPPPRPTATPQAVVLADRAAPRLELLHPRPHDVLRGGAELPLRWKVSDTHLLPDSVRIEFSRDAGTTWETIADKLGAAGERPWRVPQINCSTAQFRLFAYDARGVRDDSHRPVPCAIDAAIPTVTLELERRSRRDRISLRARLADTGPAGVAGWNLFVTVDDGTTWTRYQHYAPGETAVPFAAPDGRYGFWATVADHAGNLTLPPTEGDAPRYTCLIDTRAPTLTISGLDEGDLRRGGARALLAWEAKDANLPSLPVHFELSADDGVTFTDLRRPEAPVGSAELPLPTKSGKYLLRARVADAVGNGALVERRFAIDADPPHVALAALDLGLPLAGGTALEIRWEAADANFGPTPIALHFSRDQGKTWVPIAELQPNSGRYPWTAPRISASACLLRAVAVDCVGNAAEAVSPLPFPILTSVPLPQLTVAPVSRDRRVPLALPLAPAERETLREICLWLTRDRGRTWTVARRLEPAALPDLTLELEPGEYGFFVSAEDVAGNRTPAPGRRDAPVASLLVDLTAPVITLAEPKGPQVLRPGETVRLAWNAVDPNLLPQPCVVEAARTEPDGGATPWEPLADLQPATGSFVWAAPPGDASWLLRVRAVDRAENAGTASVAVRVAESAPQVQFAPLGRACLRGGDPLELRWTTSGGTLDPLPATLELSVDGGRRWQVLAPGLPASGSTTLKLPLIDVAACRLRLVLADARGGRAEAECERFAIASTAPGAALADLGCVNARPLLLSPVLKPGPVAPLARLELWASPDRGKTWSEVAAVTEGFDRPVPCDLADGRWLLYARPIDAAGNAPPPPADCRHGFASVTVDTRAPEVAFVGIGDGAVCTPGATIELAWEGSDRNPAPAPNAVLEVSENDGTTWTTVVSGRADRDRWRGRLPRETDAAVYRLRLADAAGNRAERTLRLALATAPLRVETAAPVGPNEVVRGGDTVRVVWRWIGGGPALEASPVRVSARIGEAPWQVLADTLPRSGEFAWDTPAVTAATELRVDAVDLDGRWVEFLAPHRFRLDADAPVVTFRGPAALADKPGTLTFEVADAGGAGAHHVDLWTADADGHGWRRRHTAAADAGRIAFDAPADGRYGIRLVGTDAVGNAQPAPAEGDAPAAVVLVDSAMPVVRLESLLGGEILAPGAEAEVRWHAADANLRPGGVRLDLSDDGGGSWAPLASGLDGSGSFRFRTPENPGETYRVRVVAEDLAGHVATAGSVSDLALDPGLPGVRLKPLGHTRESDVVLAYETAAAGRVTVRSVTLWTTADGGQSWSRAWTAQPGAPLLFHAEQDGVYGFYLVAEAATGARGADPTPGARPQESVVVDRAAPTLALGPSDWDDGFTGRGARDLSWTVVDADPEVAVAAELSADNGRTWTALPVAAGRLGAGRVTLPAATPAGAHVRIRLIAADRAGNTATSEASRLAVYDPNPPVVKFLGFDPAMKTPMVGLRWEAEDGESGVARVWARWRKAGTAIWASNEGFLPTGSPLAITVDQGRWEFQLLGADRAGNETSRAEPVRPDAELLVDTVPPVVTLTGWPARARAFGEPLELTWTTEESNPGKDPISIELSADGGADWQSALAGQPDFGRVKLPPPGKPGTYRVRVRVVDEAGNVGVSAAAASIVVEAAPGGGPAPAEAGAPKIPLAEALAWGEQAYAAKKWLEAAEAFAIATRWQPGDASLQHRLGKSLAFAGRPEEAEAALEGAVHLDPKSVEYRNDLGAFLANVGKAERAERELAASLALRETAGALYFLGTLRYNAGRYAEAAAKFRRALELAPDFKRARASLEACEARLRETPESGGRPADGAPGAGAEGAGEAGDTPAGGGDRRGRGGRE